MNKYMKTIVMTLVCLAILVPFASTAPDGLEKVAEALGIEEHAPAWFGVMPDYTVTVIQDPCFSTLLSGVFGFFLVLGLAYLLGVALTRSHD